jgi:transposase
MSQAQSLLAGLRPQFVVADKGYDCHWLRDEIRRQGGRPVIPTRRGRFHQRRYDRTRYKLRNVVERFFNRLKHFRRVATRYDKTDTNYQGFLCLAALMIILN